MVKLLILTFLLTSSALIAEDNSSVKEFQKGSSFTGRITKNKVRMRSLANLEAPVVRELARNDMVLVVGENDEFYTVVPPQNMKAYIFRTFVLDNTVEGARVNVRLEPSVDSPSIAQLNTDDKVEGIISPLNNKWLEIKMPETARFYIAKDFVEKVGDSNYISEVARKRNNVNSLLENTYNEGIAELQKPFPDIKIDPIVKNYNRVIEQESEFPDQAARAKDLVKTLQENYIKKKIAYLEMKAETKPETIIIQTIPVANAPETKPAVTAKMAAWNDVEDSLYKYWEKGHPGETLERFYEDQLLEAKEITGVVEVYNKQVNNKPGDYVLINKLNHNIIAYLYSNKVNLADKVDQEVTIKGSLRPNNSFAFPAYFVLDLVPQ